MSDKMITVEKDFTSAFVLDKPKLTRMLNILEDKFKGLHLQFRPSYEAVLANGRKISLTSLDELFALDNTVRNPIEALTIEASDLQSETKIKSAISYSDDERHNISAHVEGSDSGLALQLFAELEEQVERTLATSWVYRVLKSESLIF